MNLESNTENKLHGGWLCCRVLFCLGLVKSALGGVFRHKSGRTLKKHLSRATTQEVDSATLTLGRQMPHGIRSLVDPHGQMKGVSVNLTPQQCERIRSNVVLNLILLEFPSLSARQLVDLLRESSESNPLAIARMLDLWEHPSLLDNSMSAYASGGKCLTSVADHATNRLTYSLGGFRAFGRMFNGWQNVQAQPPPSENNLTNTQKP